LARRFTGTLNRLSCYVQKIFRKPDVIFFYAEELVTKRKTTMIEVLRHRGRDAIFTSKSQCFNTNKAGEQLNSA
jgi:hypothetical protein